MEKDRVGTQYLRVRDFCRILSLPPSTAYRMISSGKLKVVRLAITPSNPRGIVRIPREEVDRILAPSKEDQPTRR